MPDSTMNSICEKAYCVTIVGSMPIQLNPISDTFFRTTFLDERIPCFRENPVTKYYISALVCLCGCSLVSQIIPSLDVLFNITGSGMGIFTMTIFPVVFYNKVFADEITWKRWFIHTVICTTIVV